jgi:hypothetical protein
MGIWHRASDPIPRPRRRPGKRPNVPRGPLTWAILCELEPRLVTLEREIVAMPRRRDSLMIWYERFKPELWALVGWGAENLYTQDDPLGTSGAYEIAYHHLVDLLQRPRRRRRHGLSPLGGRHSRRSNAATI